VDKLLSNKNAIRVLSLLIGILLWLIVNQEQKIVIDTSTAAIEKTQTINNVKVEPKLQGNQIHIVSITPETVQVVVRGKDAALKKVNTTQAHIEVDLSKVVGKGEYVLPLTDVGFPTTVDVLEIVPRQVKVVVEDLQKVELPVEIDVTGKTAEGLKTGAAIVKPNRVHVTLPTSVMDDAVTVKGVVSVEGAKETVKKQVKLKAYNKAGKELDFEITPAVVDVEVPVTSPFKQIPLQVTLKGQPAPGFAISKVTQTVEKVIVFGDQSVLDAIEFYEGPTLDITGLSETKEYTLDVPIKHKVTIVDPPKVTVRVEIVQAVSKTLDGVVITPVGQSDAFTTKVLAPDNGTVSLTVEGAPERVANLKSVDIQALVDVTNLAPNTYDLNVTYNVPPFIKVILPADLKAKVEITSKQHAGGATEVNGGAGNGGKTEAGAGGSAGGGQNGGGTASPSTSPSPSPGANGGGG